MDEKILYNIFVSVSYTHLDVYKRQVTGILRTEDNFDGIILKGVAKDLSLIHI